MHCSSDVSRTTCRKLCLFNDSEHSCYVGFTVQQRVSYILFYRIAFTWSSNWSDGFVEWSDGFVECA